jgi:hypothetical protein
VYFSERPVMLIECRAVVIALVLGASSQPAEGQRLTPEFPMSGVGALAANTGFERPIAA